MTTQTSSSIPLRAHHIDSFRGMVIDDLSREEVAKGLLNLGYIKSLDDPFVDDSYTRLENLFKNPEQKFLIVAYTPDFICEACPFKTSRVGCFSLEDELKSQKEKLKSRAPFAELMGIEDDFYFAKDYGLEIGKEYTVREIRQKAGF